MRRSAVALALPLPLPLLLPLLHLGLLDAAAAPWVEDEGLRRQTESRVASPAKRFTVDLDLAPEDRWATLAEDPSFANYGRDVTAYVEKFIPKRVFPLVTRLLSTLDGTFYPEYASEMKGIARALNVTVGDVVLVNLIYQLERIGRSCEAGNTTGPCPPKSAGPGLCTGVVAENEEKGEIWEGRNLDWNLDAVLLQYVLRVDYQKGNETLFSAVQIVGEVGVLHGVRPGAWSGQMNARDEGGDVLENILNDLLTGAKCPTTVLRYALEHSADYKGAVSYLSSQRLVNPAFFIIAGTEHAEGAILTRNRRGLADRWSLYQDPAKDTKRINIQPGWFRLQTNFNHWEPPPTWDDRRTPGVKHVEEFCNGTVGQESVMKVMSAWPTKSHHTDITSVMCAKTGYMDVTVWVPPPPAAIIV